MGKTNLDRTCKKLEAFFTSIGFKPSLFPAGTPLEYYFALIMPITDLHLLGSRTGIDGPSLGIAIYDYESGLIWFPSIKATEEDYERMCHA